MSPPSRAMTVVDAHAMTIFDAGARRAAAEASRRNSSPLRHGAHSSPRGYTASPTLPTAPRARPQEVDTINPCPRLEPSEATPDTANVRHRHGTASSE